MEFSIWGTVAAKMATTLRRVQPIRPQGVILVHHADQDHLIIWLYDVDAAGPAEHLSCELDLLRPRLKQAGVEELGFGQSPDGRAWTLIGRADQQAFHTKAGKTFFREMLAENLSAILREAWVTAHLISTPDSEEALAKKD